MKKILALVLALMLVLSTSVVAFAAENSVGDKSGSVNVEITKEDNITGDPNDVDSGATYEIDIDLIDMTFTYSFGAYDTATHEYADTKWDKTSADIAVSNHSNTSLDISAKFADGTTDYTKTEDGVTATITTTTTVRIASAVGTDRATATPQGKINVTIAGEPTVSTGWKLATVTLTIAATTK